MTIYNHQQKIHIGNVLKEVMFGIEDGMVSTLGALTGIAIGSQDKNTIVLAGMVIIAVESISMGVGSYLANKTKQSTDERKLKEEKIELRKYPDEEKEELHKMFIRDGWSRNLAGRMMQEIVLDKKLMLKEMAYRELQISINKPMSAIKSGLYMFFSYVLGGIIPLASYFVFPVVTATPFSIVITLMGLFILGIVMTKFTNDTWHKSGLRVLLLGGIAMTVGFIVGELFSVTH